MNGSRFEKLQLLERLQRRLHQPGLLSLLADLRHKLAQSLDDCPKLISQFERPLDHVHLGG